MYGLLLQLTSPDLSGCGSYPGNSESSSAVVVVGLLLCARIAAVVDPRAVGMGSTAHADAASSTHVLGLTSALCGPTIVLFVSSSCRPHPSSSAPPPLGSSQHLHGPSANARSKASLSRSRISLDPCLHQSHALIYSISIPASYEPRTRGMIA